MTKEIGEPFLPMVAYGQRQAGLKVNTRIVEEQ
jgi:hypothetical protein